jgi:hypothetical protein
MNNIFDEWRVMYQRPHLSDIPVIYSEYACDPEFEWVERTWKERLFTRPWNPRRKWKQVMTSLNPLMYRINTANGPMIITHPALKGELEKI